MVSLSQPLLYFEYTLLLLVGLLVLGLLVFGDWLERDSRLVVYYTGEIGNIYLL